MKPRQQAQKRSSLPPTPPRVPWLMALAGLVGLIGLGLLQTAQPPAQAQSGPVSGPALVEPLALTSQNGVLDATLVEKADVTALAGMQVQNVWTYHVGEDGPPNYAGPTLYVKPGDTLRLRIVNRLPPSMSPRQATPAGGGPGPTPTNLHTHGLHVSPLGNSDNVLISIPPNGAANQYEIKIPRDHPQGLYWYHPHRHQYAREQMLRGLAGLIVVGRPDGGPPQLNGLQQRLLVLQYSIISPGPPPVMMRNVGDNAPAQVHFTVNGQENPTIDIRPGESQVWNLCNATPNGYFYLRIKGVNGTSDQPLVAVAQDGNPYTKPVTYPATQPLLIPSGARFSLLVQGPPAGTYQIEMVPWNDGFSWWPPNPAWSDFGGPDNLMPPPVPRTLATIVSGGDPVRPLPVPQRLTPPANYFERLDQLPVDYQRIAEYGAIFEGTPDNLTNVIFLINGAPFPRNPVFQPRLNTVEEWVVTNTTIEQHPFHPHQNDFQILSVDDAGNPSNNFSDPHSYLQDTINLPKAVQIDPRSQLLRASTVVMRIRFRDFLGTYVQHCHRVDHEDRSQMALITAIPETPVYATGAGPDLPPVVKIFNGMDDRPLEQINAFGGGSRGGVRVAVGDVNQDTVMDVLAVPGPGGPSRVRVLSGKQRFRRTLFDLRAFDQSFTGGLNVASGDMNADGYDDIIVAPAGGGPPEVRIFSGKDGSLLGSFMAYESNFQGGVTLASAIVQATGRYSIITGPGPGRASEVRVFDVDWYGLHAQARAAELNCKCKKGFCACGESKCACSVGKCECSPKPVAVMAVAPGTLKPIFQTASAMAYEAGFMGGVNVGTGPMAGQNGGFASILTGPASSHSPLVKSFVVASSAHDLGMETPSIVETAAFQAFPASFDTGVWVSSISTPEGADLLVSPGPNQPPMLQRFAFQADPGTTPRVRPVHGTFTPVAAFNAFAANLPRRRRGGGTIAAPRPPGVLRDHGEPPLSLRDSAPCRGARCGARGEPSGGRGGPHRKRKGEDDGRADRRQRGSGHPARAPGAT